MRTNVRTPYAPVRTHEGAAANRINSYLELRRTVLTCLLFEDTFYEKGSDIAARIAELVKQTDPVKVADLAIEARDRLYLRHVPLFLARELARTKGNGPQVERVLSRVIQRADELAEFLAMYWKDKRQPLSAGVKRGLASAFGKFDAYRLAKYNRDNAVKLRDVLFLVHAKPKDDEQAQLWKRLVEGTLESPDTWEVELSAGKNKKETFERLLRERKLGGLAVLRNLRNMLAAGVDEDLIRDRLAEGIPRAFPYRFVVAAKYAPVLEDAIEVAMLQAVEQVEMLPGKTGLLVDVSGSMDASLDQKRVVPDPTTRIDVAAGLAILLREKAESVKVWTFSSGLVPVPPRTGFALRDAIQKSQPHSSTNLGGALRGIDTQLDRLIVITDEQSHDRISQAPVKPTYVVNVAPYRHGVSYGNGYTHIDGWSERVFDFIREIEQEQAE